MFCPNCGREVAVNATFCRNCGTKIELNTIARVNVTPASSVEYAGFWRRFGAWIIDGIILNVISWIIGLILGLVFAFASGMSYFLSPIAYILGISLGWLYYALFESSPKQATPGKMALGIVVTDSQDNGISFARATGRYIGKIISGIILLIGYIMIAFTAKKQGLHDMIADTYVVVK